MRFGSIIVAGLAAVASAMPAKEVSSNIDAVTLKSRELQVPAKSPTIIDGPLLTARQGKIPPIILRFRDIMYTFATYTEEMSTSKEKYSGDGADLIYNSFREMSTFVMVHQELLNILIKKADLFTTVPFIGQPMVTVLEGVESGIDTFVYGLIDMMQTHANDLQSSNDALDSTLDVCIDSYNELQ